MTNTTPALTPANYFQARNDCHNFCRITGSVVPGERHDPRCAIVATVEYGEREAIAEEAERLAPR